MDPDDTLVIRMGTFFLVLGGGIFVLFILSDIANQADFDYLFISMIMIFFGWYFRRGKSKPSSSNRFEWFRNWRSGKKGGGGRPKSKSKPMPAAAKPKDDDDDYDYEEE